METTLTTFDSGFVTVESATRSPERRGRSSIACVIPAYNEEESIAEVLDGLLTQTRPPDVIHVVINNTTDGVAAYDEAIVEDDAVHLTLEQIHTE